MEELSSALLSALVTAVPVLVTALAGLVAAALVALTRRLSAQAGESRLSQAVRRASMLAEAVVRDLEVTLRPKLVDATADGVLTPAEWRELKEAALSRLRVSLGERGLEELSASLRASPSGLAVFLSGLIEGAVAKMKGEGGSGSVTIGPLEVGAAGVRELLGEPQVVASPGSSSAPAAPSSSSPLAALLLVVPLVGLLGQGCTPLHARRGDARAGPTQAGLKVPAVDYRPTATDSQCAAWDSHRLTWGVVGTVAGALGAAGGGVTLLTDLVGHDRGAQLALGLTSVLLGALTVGASYAEDGLTARFTARCTVAAQPSPAR